MNRDIKICTIGGGTGTYTVLMGLKKYKVDLSVIISMMDSGGSNRIIRDEFGLLPTSDLRQAMVALASEKSNELLRKLFTYRYSQGIGISGMTFGNLFMAALTEILGSQEKAIKETCDLLGVRGKIIPVTLENTNLVARYDNGRQILGEHNIDEPNKDLNHHKIVEMSLFPPAKVNIEAIEAIREAKMIVLTPGDLYTSIIPNLLVKGIKSALKQKKGKLVYVLNLMTKYGQTIGFKASDFLRNVNKYLGGNMVDIILINNNNNISKNIIKRYQEEKAFMVIDDLGKKRDIEIIRKDLISETAYEKSKGDRLIRSLIRHDPDKLAAALMNLK